MTRGLPALPDDWSNAEFGSLLPSGTRNGIYKPKQFQGRGAKIVKMGELFAHPRLTPVEMDRIEVTEDEVAKWALQPGDLLFARRSYVAEGAGHCAVVCSVDGPTVFESSIIRARPGDNVDSFYLYYLFSSPIGRGLLKSIRRQTSVSGIAASDLVKLTIPLPPLSEQRAIASILSRLDEKISLNRRTNSTLQATARAIFRSWFVDFDPVVAKADGREPFGMDAETAALFPDAFRETEHGVVPSGWEWSTIGTEVEAVGGSTPSTRNPAYWEGGTTHWATPKDLSGIEESALLDTDRKITEKGLEKISSGLLPAGTMLLSSRAPIGYLAIAEVPLAVNQGFIAMRCEGRLPNHYVLHWTRENLNEIRARAGGTTFPEISKRNFRPIPVLVPTQPLLDRWQELADSLHAKVVANLYESRTLALLRDLLLPKLLSGDIRVTEAEEVVADPGAAAADQMSLL